MVIYGIVGLAGEGAAVTWGHGIFFRPSFVAKQRLEKMSLGTSSSPPPTPVRENDENAIPPTPQSGTPLRLGATPVRGMSALRPLTSSKKNRFPRSAIGGFTAQKAKPRIAATPEKPESEDDMEEDLPKKQTEPLDVDDKRHYVYGTRILIEDMMVEFARFLRQYRPRREVFEATQEPYYLRALRSAGASSEATYLDINCRHLHGFSPELYNNLVRHPQEVISCMDMQIAEELEQLTGLTDVPVPARPFNLRQLHEVRMLDPEHIDTMVSVVGMVTRTSAIIPDLKQACYRCTVCGKIVDVGIDKGRVEEPGKCPRQSCQAKKSMELVHNRCYFSDKQIVRLQENPESMPEGATPHATTIFAFDNMCDYVRPGDRVEVTGIYKAIARRVNPRVTTCKTLFKTYIDAIHFKVKGNERDDPFAATVGEHSDNEDESDDDDFLDDDDDDDAAIERKHEKIREKRKKAEEKKAKRAEAVRKDPRKAVSFSKARIEAFKAFADEGDTYDRLATCVAPSIYGMEDVKKGVLCMLFGGVARERVLRDDVAVASPDEEEKETTPDDDDNSLQEKKDEKVAKSRGDINVLLCGDPGTSKSQLLTYVHKIAPRGVYTSGKGSSAVGLTASINRDPETKELVMDSGAVVLSDLGICCIDEFGK